MSLRVLVVEDAHDAAASTARSLRAAEHTVTRAGNGRDGLAMAASNPYDVIVLNGLLPAGDIGGVDLVEALRMRGDTTPVLFLSALSGVDDRLRAYYAGADDFLAKPFASAELRVRVQVLARRRRAERPCIRLRVADLDMDLVSRAVTRAGRRVALAPLEFRLLECLVRHAGQAVTPATLSAEVWDSRCSLQAKVIKVQVSRLRCKLDKPFPTPLIRTVRTVGYMLWAGAEVAGNPALGGAAAGIGAPGAAEAMSARHLRRTPFPLGEHDRGQRPVFPRQRTNQHPTIYDAIQPCIKIRESTKDTV